MNKIAPGDGKWGKRREVDEKRARMMTEVLEMPYYCQYVCTYLEWIGTKVEESQIIVVV